MHICPVTGLFLDSIDSNEFDLSKCRGQGYESTANISGVYSIVQARIIEMEPTESKFDTE